MSFNVIGVGPGDSELITVKAVRLIKEADLIIVPVKKEGSTKSTALTIAKPYIEDMEKVKYLCFPMVSGFADDCKVLFKEHGNSINKYIEQGLNIVFLTLGDPSVYSTFAYIAPYLNDINYIPGITSFLNGAALSKIPLCLGEESLAIINMTDDPEQIRQLFKMHKNIVVMKVCANQALLKELLVGRDFRFMSNIGLENESFTTNLDVLDTKMPYFTIGLIK